MPKRNKQSKSTSDVNQVAYNLVQLSTQKTEIDDSPRASFILSQYMAKIGKKGGKIGGKRRLKTMTAKKRKDVARKAARARWKHQVTSRT